MNLVVINCSIPCDEALARRLAALGHRIQSLSHDAGDPGATIETLLAKLPLGFKPDTILVWGADYNGIPPGIERARARTIIQVNDFHLTYEAQLPHLKRFDAIWTHARGIEVFRAAGFENFIDAPLYSYAARVPELPAIEKDLDVVFVGGLNGAIHAERNRWLFRLCKLSHRFRIRVASGIFGSDFHREIARAKIAFNHGVLHETNMRCFEAAAHGAMLFLPRSNDQASSVFPDGEAAVYFDESDFETKLNAYLTNTAERERIATNAKRIALRMAQEQWISFIEQAERTSSGDPSVRNYSDPRPERVAIAQATNIWCGFRAETDRVAMSKFCEAIEIDGADAEGWTGIAFQHLREAKRASGSAQEGLVHLALANLRRASEIDRDYVCSRLSLGLVAGDVGLHEEAEAALRETISLCERGDLSETKFRGLVYPTHFDHFRVAREKVLYENSGDAIEKTRLLAALFRLRASEALASLCLRRGDLGAAFEIVTQTVESSVELSDPLPSFYQLLAELAWSVGDEDGAIGYGARAHGIDPLHVDLWKTHLERFFVARRFEEALGFSRDCAAAAKALDAAAPALGFFEGMTAALEANLEAYRRWEKAKRLCDGGEFAPALEEFRGAQATFIRTHAFALEHGLALLQCGHHEDALPLLDFAQTDPDCRFLGIAGSVKALRALGNNERADVYERRLADAPAC